MFERHATASRPRDDRHRRDDEPGEFLYLHPRAACSQLLSGQWPQAWSSCSAPGSQPRCVGVGAAATLVATVGLAVAMLMPHRPRRHGARPVRPAAR